MSDELCGLCGEKALGVANADGVRLCHAAEKSCYREWTVYGWRRHGCSRCGPFTGPEPQYFFIGSHRVILCEGCLCVIVEAWHDDQATWPPEPVL